MCACTCGRVHVLSARTCTIVCLGVACWRIPLIHSSQFAKFVRPNHETLLRVFKWIQEWYDIQAQSPIWKLCLHMMEKRIVSPLFLALLSKLFILFNKIWNNALNSSLRVVRYSKIKAQNRDFTDIAWMWKFLKILSAT